jgi:hypothetical protein
MKINLSFVWLAMLLFSFSINNPVTGKEVIKYFFVSVKKNKNSDKKVKDLPRYKRRIVYRYMKIPSFNSKVCNKFRVIEKLRLLKNKLSNVSY